MAVSESSTLPWHTILEQVAGPVAVVDLQGRFVYVNPAFCQLLGYHRDDVIGRIPREFTHPHDFAVDRDAIEGVIQGSEERFEVEKRFLHSDGTAIWTLVTSTVIRGIDGRPLFFVSQVHDITARREAEQRWHQTVTNATIGMAVLNLDGRFSEVNDRLCALLGYSRDELLKMTFLDLAYPDDAPESRKLFAELVAGRRDTVAGERRYRHKDGRPLWMRIRTSVVTDADNHPSYLVTQFDTISDERLDGRHLAHLALHDALTGLANRVLLHDRLEQAITELPHKNDEVLAVLLIDLDNLKPTNDQYGHDVGDQLLTTTADELLNSVRAGDTVARLGGDEFVILTKVNDFAAAESFRERVEQRLDTEFLASGQLLSLRASVGLAATQNPTTLPETILRCADRDMYSRKRARAT